MTKGIKEYFNAMLGSQLLYRWERPQYGELISKNANLVPCETYGAFHLLRLFGRQTFNHYVW